MGKLAGILNSLEAFREEIETQSIADMYNVPREKMDEPYQPEEPQASDEELVAAITATLVDLSETVAKSVEEAAGRSSDGISAAVDAHKETAKDLGRRFDGIKSVLKTGAENSKKAITAGTGQIAKSISDGNEKTQRALDALSEQLKELHQEQPRSLATVVEALTEALKQPEPAAFRHDIRRDEDGLLKTVYSAPVQSIPSPDDGISID